MAAGIRDGDVCYHLRDKNPSMVAAFTSTFKDYSHKNIRISQGDIVGGGTTADAVVCPTNSFAFMSGLNAVDKDFVDKFGHQIETRLQNLIQNEHGGEIPVGNCLLIESYGQEYKGVRLPIKYFILAPTLRVPGDISKTVNAYMAFRAVILEVRKHNRSNAVDPIESVLLPGLGSGGGHMPVERCAWQMLQAYETIALGKHTSRIRPDSLNVAIADHNALSTK